MAQADDLDLEWQVKLKVNQIFKSYNLYRS